MYYSYCKQRERKLWVKARFVRHVYRGGPKVYFRSAKRHRKCWLHKHWLKWARYVNCFPPLAAFICERIFVELCLYSFKIRFLASLFQAIVSRALYIFRIVSTSSLPDLNLKRISPESTRTLWPSTKGQEKKMKCKSGGKKRNRNKSRARDRPRRFAVSSHFVHIREYFRKKHQISKGQTMEKWKVYRV